MNTATQGRTLTQHRKVSVSFRDLALLNIFKMSLVSLRMMLNNAAVDDKLREEVRGPGGHAGRVSRCWCMVCCVACCQQLCADSMQLLSCTMAWHCVFILP